MDDEENKQVRKPVSLRKNISYYFREYCGCTSVHGFIYLGERRTICEKLWWIISFMACLVVLGICINAMYNKWNNSPVIVSFATKPVPIYSIPFPAITICSESKLNATAYNYSRIMEKYTTNDNMTLKEIKILNYMSSICSDLNSTQFLDVEPEDFLDIIEEVTPNYFPTECFLLGTPTSCSELFTPILTDEGLCYTTNMLDRADMFQENVVHYKNYQAFSTTGTDWNMETGYSSSAGVLAYPRRALLAGGRYSFTFDVITIRDEIEGTCRDSVEGYKVLLHEPIRIPRLTQQYFRVPLDEIVVATITPSMINTSVAVKNHPPEKRECYFSSERKLKYFKHYSKTNCNFECFTDYTLDQCDCVHFSMPRENGTKICGGQDIRCMEAVEYTLQIAHLITNIGDEEIGTESMEKLKNLDCDCLPMCTDIHYKAETSQTKWSWTRDKNSFRNLTESEYYMSKLAVFFTSGDFIPSERNELYGPLDFLANFGGLLGLFTGFSILSLIEIVYFLTARLICNIRLHGHWWSA